MDNLPSTVPLRYIIMMAGYTGNYRVAYKETNGFTQDIYLGNGKDAGDVYFKLIKTLHESRFWRTVGSSISGTMVYTIVEWQGDFNMIFNAEKTK